MPHIPGQMSNSEEIASTLDRRVDLPSGGYLVFDYAEAFTVIDVNTGRFVGSRSRTSTARLEETVTKNNVEAAATIGKAIAERAKKAGVEECYFDRGGFLFHGKIKALADAAREGGLKF